MSKDCWIVFFIVISSLSFLAYLIIAVFVTPINVQCDQNDTIPQDSPINLSMSQWLSFGMIFGIAFFALVAGCTKTKSNSDCLIAVFIVIIILYVIFIFVWSTIGLVIYEHYYAQACKDVDSYNLYAGLGIFFGLGFSSTHILAALGAAIYHFLKGCCDRIERVPLLIDQAPQIPPAPQVGEDIISQIQASQQRGDNEKQYAKLPPKKQQVVMVTDAQFQQNRNIYQNMFNRLSGNRWSRDHRQN